MTDSFYEEEEEIVMDGDEILEEEEEEEIETETVSANDLHEKILNMDEPALIKRVTSATPEVPEALLREASTLIVQIQATIERRTGIEDLNKSLAEERRCLLSLVKTLELPINLFDSSDNEEDQDVINKMPGRLLTDIPKERMREVRVHVVSATHRMLENNTKLQQEKGMLTRRSVALEEENVKLKADLESAAKRNKELEKQLDLLRKCNKPQAVEKTQKPEKPAAPVITEKEGKAAKAKVAVKTSAKVPGVKLNVLKSFMAGNLKK